MLFSSIKVLYYFLPFVILVYFLVPKSIKNAVLLVFSLLFYGWGEPKYVFLMMLTVAVNYFLGLGIERYRGRAGAKLLMGISAAFSLGLLGYFKYAGFFAENLARITGVELPVLNVVLPIGISFYTFQILSYTIDVYRGSVKAQRNPVTLGAYISLFPQLIAGPIVRYADVELQLKNRRHSIDKAYLGIRRFVTGLGKKIIIANTLGELCEAITLTSDKSVMLSWLFALSYMLQIYFDFSGYSDMAIGLGKIFGFDFLENFRYPFVSSSISDFWRRWHISLGSWFRDYVYIPLGGNRKGKLRTMINLIAVWLLTGLWHGAEWNFVIWGMYFGILILAEKLFLSAFLSKNKIISHIYVIFLVLISFAIFSASDMPEAISRVGSMLGMSDVPLISQSFVFNIRNYGFVIAYAMVCSTPLLLSIRQRIMSVPRARMVLDILEIPALAVILIVTTAYLADGSFNPFLYFRF